jgi:antibiotic biosynthesis monooxygenase (ABM) superfamily enzyme
MVYLIRAAVDPVREAEWLAWQRPTHIPEVLRQPGFVGARMFSVTLTQGWLEYVVHYELHDAAALEAYLDSEACLRLWADHTNRFGDVTRVSREYWQEVSNA